MALRPRWTGRVYAHPPALVRLRGTASVAGPTFMPAGCTGLRKAEDGEKVGVLYNAHERESPAGASTVRTLVVAQTETCPGTGIDLGS